MVQQWAWYLLAAGANKIPKAKGKRKVTIERFSRRAIDHANIYLAADKCILDNLVKCGVLVDDSDEFLILEVRGKVERGDPRTVVVIEEVEEEQEQEEPSRSSSSRSY